MFDSEALFELKTAVADQKDADRRDLARMACMPMEGLMSPDWAAALAPVRDELRNVLEFVAAEAAGGHMILPSPSNILRAFRQPMAKVKILVVGQDPYPTPGHAVGLSFSVNRKTRPIPRSLANIFSELEADLGLPPRVHGDLTHWADQGVLLLNRLLSVRAGAAGSHRGKGWEAITATAISALSERQVADGSKAPLVAILWGKDADSVRPLLGDTPVLASAHPSPLSASRGFFGSRPFSRANSLLQEQGADPVNWELPVL